jgi:tripartite-type tricarboxylate transporter receptor subunit TctC
MRPRCRLGLIVALFTAGSVPAHAQQNYPTKPIHIVVPYAAGGSVDPIARLVGDRLAKLVGQPVVIENRPGAGGNIGIETVVRGTHDGYTLLATPSAVTINPSLYAKVPYDLDQDLVPIGLVNRNAMVVLVNPSWGVKTLGDLVARARESQGRLNYGITGNGTLDHLVCENLRASAKLDMVKINYQGVPRTMTALMAGEVQVMVASMTAALPQIQSGKLQALAVTSSERAAHLPDVPTMRELGYPDFVMYGWSMLFAPAGTPRPIVEKLHDDIAKVVAQPDVAKIIADLGSEPQALSLDELKAYVHREAAFFAGIVKASGARVD